MYLIRKYTKRFYHKLIDSLFEKFLNLLLRYPIIKKKKDFREEGKLSKRFINAMGSSSRTISTAKRRSFPPRPSKLENTFSRPEQSRLFLIALTNSSAYLVFAVSVSLFSGFHDRLQARPPFPPTTLGFWGTVSHATFYTIPLDRITTKLLAAFRSVRQVDNRLGEKSRTHNA